MKYLLITFLLTYSTLSAQIAPQIAFSDYIKINFYRDSCTVDTFDLHQSFMSIKFDSSSISLQGVDTLQIVSITSKPDSVLFFVLIKVVKTDSTIDVTENITAVLTPDYLYLEYPRIRTKRGATDAPKPQENVYTCYNFTLVRQQKSVSN